MRRYVILEHTLGSGEVHYDLCLEEAPAPAAPAAAAPDDPDARCLVTFQLEGPPSREGAVAGTRSFDHRRLYLAYEGELSGGRGAVRIWDRGHAHDLAGEPRGPRYAFRCEGERLSGAFELSAGLAEGAPARLAPRAA